MEDPLDFMAIEDLKMMTDYEIAPMISYKKSIDNAIARLYGSETSDEAIKEFQRESGFLNIQAA